ncbi:hypothetical protein WMY93_025386 [Mugilogobius chulae]|uniref:Uncharacterized protein n=1 Tax=Mugilogobius chulae TaxID=88201 RepID=A0AAW0N2G2_9GOBI
MEQTDPSHSPSGRDAACGLYSKRLKELENAALQTTLISKMDTEPPPEQIPGTEEQSSGLSLNHEAAQAEEEAGRCVVPPEPRREEERTLTDHLNKRLLSSFLEKLNERDLALPGVRHLDCAVADEDSNRAADEW